MLEIGAKVIFRDKPYSYFSDYEGVIFTVKVSYLNSQGTNNIMLEELDRPHLVDAKLLQNVNDIKTFNCSFCKDTRCIGECYE